VRLGSSEAGDRWGGYFANMPAAVEAVCEAARGTPALAGGYYGVGLSQGAQFLRALGESCGPGAGAAGPALLRLVSLGGQHRGVSQVPRCGGAGDDSAYCARARALVSRGAYLPWVRDHVVQAQYFRDPRRVGEYLARGVFLPRVNNEVPGARDPRAAAAVGAMEALVLVMFEGDEMVVPRESSWFGEEQASAPAEGRGWGGAAPARAPARAPRDAAARAAPRAQEDGSVLDLRDTALYREDWIGLRALDEAGRLHLLSCPGGHLQFDREWFAGAVLPFLAT